MTFKEYFLKESPDLVYTPKKRALNWFSRDAVTFGTLWGLIDINPFFIHSLKKGFSHYDMLEDLIIEIETSYHIFEEKLGRKPTVEEVEDLYKRKLTWNKRWSIHPKDATRIAKEIANSKHLMKHIQRETLYNNIDRARNGRETGKTSIEKDLSNKIRTEIYRNAGRVWPSSKVISFWLAEDQLTPQILDETFKNLNIRDKQKYFVDVVNLNELDKEETNRKVLPSYKDYKKKSAPKDDLSDEQKKKAAEFMAKQHGVAGAQKAKFGTNKELPPVGAKKYAQQMPLDVRQQAQTSESLSVD
jgi:hypothetical protein